MSGDTDPLAIALFSEILMAGQLARNRLSRALPKGMELSHFSVLNHLAHTKRDRSPAQLAETFHVTRGAMTNTLSKLEQSGHIHIRPDWEDHRRKIVTISTAGRAALQSALAGMAPVLDDMVSGVGREGIRAALPVLRNIRARFEPE
ncbi:MarR family winged helix-turn-helix transcriptional regulator [Oceaniglobus ichthyenteri]|uniref:MarR family winged helix-turn-helix transcriptional regulator n=1 Tax=Oceaniglobus ichthyenteri TaxID=2136177 RepID=UPI000D379CBC|nr:MarR family transcriptional regulator [Oceaniglobus ichthyenteri]